MQQWHTLKMNFGRVSFHGTLAYTFYVTANCHKKTFEIFKYQHLNTDD